MRLIASGSPVDAHQVSRNQLSGRMVPQGAGCISTEFSVPVTNCVCKQAKDEGGTSNALGADLGLVEALITKNQVQRRVDSIATTSIGFPRRSLAEDGNGTLAVFATIATLVLSSHESPFLLDFESEA